MLTIKQIFDFMIRTTVQSVVAVGLSILFKMNEDDSRNKIEVDDYSNSSFKFDRGEN